MILIKVTLGSKTITFHNETVSPCELLEQLDPYCHVGVRLQVTIQDATSCERHE